MRHRMRLDANTGNADTFAFDESRPCSAKWVQNHTLVV
jgi:hypothetical protein